MAPLAHTLALLAMTLATAAIDEERMDMAPNSFDDQYRGCGPAMTAALPALNRSEFQDNPVFAQAWLKAVAEWQRKGSPVSPLSSSAQAIAVMAYSMKYVYRPFNDAVREAGSSPQEYRDNFHFKTLHFLLTQALVKLREDQNAQCRNVFRGVRDVCFMARRGQRVRFGHFTSTSLSMMSPDAMGQTQYSRWERPFGPLPPWRPRPGHHSTGSGHRDPLSHKATNITAVTVATVANIITKTP
ncbi:hypothetical protein DUI87_32724 [Hirundo rustica rustica]|uniref:NAD(P)(+)--arginine ADP-ribosyltransferase n=1 Tax=Hirundo rustica rustica TaxID=333673 RepID=A0A3M0INF4_HIRRU|nr:hypothetical protein DUI87_32724 [Hirundo rustica rustica]